jgi:hypothetical protein
MRVAETDVTVPMMLRRSGAAARWRRCRELARVCPEDEHTAGMDYLFRTSLPPPYQLDAVLNSVNYYHE